MNDVEACQALKQTLTEVQEAVHELHEKAVKSFQEHERNPERPLELYVTGLQAQWERIKPTPPVMKSLEALHRRHPDALVAYGTMVSVVRTNMNLFAGLTGTPDAVRDNAQIIFSAYKTFEEHLTNVLSACNE